MRPQVALPSLLVALLLAALVAVGCGGGGDSGESASKLLDQTFSSKNPKIKSGNMALAFDADVKGVADPVRVKLKGPFVSSTSPDKLPRFDFTATLTSGGTTTQLGAVSTGDKGFLKYQGANYSVPDKLFKEFADRYTTSQKQSSANPAGTQSLLSLGIHPRAWLVDPKVAGDADVGGTATTHITADIDTAKLLADVQKGAAKASSVAGTTQSLTKTDVDQLAKSVKSAKVDIYTGKDDHRLRKFALDLQLTTGHVLISLEYDQMDEPQTIKAPADAQSLESLTGSLNGTGSSSSGSSTQAAPSTAGSGANQQYLTCVQQAGQDIAKVQACAKYL
jgi:hypothetical protein